MFIKFSDIKMYKKLILSFIAISIIPISILGTVTVIHFRNFALESSAKEVYNNLNSAKFQIMKVTEEVVKIADKLMIDQRLKELLLYRYKSPMETFIKYSQYREIENYKTLFANAIAYIRIYSENPTILENGIFYKVKDYIRKENWYRTAINLNGFIKWELIYQKEDIYPDKYFSLVRLLRDPYNESFGVLVINLNKLGLKKILNNQSFDTFLINDDGNIVASNNENLISTIFSIDRLKIMQPNGYSLKYNNKDYRIFGIYLPLAGYNKDFYLVSMVPLDYIMREPYNMFRFALSIIGITIGLSIFFTLIFSKNMSKRITMLNDIVNEISHGNWDMEFSIPGKDEIGELAKNVKNMARNIKLLNELKIKQKEMKLKILTNNLNPHFLFNTLETIHMMAICKEQFDIADIILKLGNLLRKIIEFDGKPIKLKTELELVEDYLKIQKYRFGKIDYKINIYEDIEDLYILPFLIQPIVENSIIHGLEEKEEKGIININIKKEEDKLIISVEDNGVGMSQEEVEAIFNNEDLSGKKIGLKNTMERIKLFYGEEFGLRVQSEIGKGTRVDIILPYYMLKGRDRYVQGINS